MEPPTPGTVTKIIQSFHGQLLTPHPSTTTAAEVATAGYGGSPIPEESKPMVDSSSADETGGVGAMSEVERQSEEKAFEPSSEAQYHHLLQVHHQQVVQRLSQQSQGHPS